MCDRLCGPVIGLPPTVAAEHLVDHDGEIEIGSGVTIMGRWSAAFATEDRNRFLAFNPGAAKTQLAKLRVQGIVIKRSGFETWFGEKNWLLRPAAWFSRETYIVDHMNSDHRREMSAMCKHFHMVDEQMPTMLAADPEGMHLLAGKRTLYFGFRRYCDTVDEVARETVYLARTAMGRATE